MRPSPKSPTSLDAQASAADHETLQITVPQRAKGVELLGEYQDSGLVVSTYLVRRGDGQVVQLSQLLYSVLVQVDGVKSAAEIASALHAAVPAPNTEANAEATALPLSTEGVEYLLDHKLAPSGLLATNSAGAQFAFTPQPQNTGILSVRARRVIVPERWVNRIARAASIFFWSPVIVIALVAFVIVDGYLIFSADLNAALQTVVADPALVLSTFGVVVVAMLLHECGHAAGCRYGGARPGAIGMGIYIVWPAFYTNVTDSYRLSRRGRLRVDLGGVYFNILGILMLSGWFAATTSPVALVALVLVHAEMGQQLLPTFRLDGNFILTDIIGVPDMFSRGVPAIRSLLRPSRIDPRISELKRSARLTLFAWTSGTLLIVLVQLSFLVRYGPTVIPAYYHSIVDTTQLVGPEFSHQQYAATAFAVVSVFFLVLPLVGTILVLGSISTNLLWLYRQQHKRRREAVVLSPASLDTTSVDTPPTFNVDGAESDVASVISELKTSLHELNTVTSDLNRAKHLRNTLEDAKALVAETRSNIDSARSMLRELVAEEDVNGVVNEAKAAVHDVTVLIEESRAVVGDEVISPPAK